MERKEGEREKMMMREPEKMKYNNWKFSSFFSMREKERQSLRVVSVFQRLPLFLPRTFSALQKERKYKKSEEERETSLRRRRENYFVVGVLLLQVSTPKYGWSFHRKRTGKEMCEKNGSQEKNSFWVVGRKEGEGKKGEEKKEWKGK